MEKAEKACKDRGWDVRLAIKKLHREDNTAYTSPRTLAAARAAMHGFMAWEAQLG